VVTQQVQYGAAAAARSVQYRKPHPGTAWYASDRSVSSSTVLGEENKKEIGVKAGTDETSSAPPSRSSVDPHQQKIYLPSDL